MTMIADEDIGKTYRMVRNAILIGAPVALLAECLRWDDFHQDHIDYLGGVILSWVGENNTIPKWLIKTIHLERLDIVFTEHIKGEVGKHCGNAELLALVHTFDEYRKGIKCEQSPSDWYINLSLYCFSEVAKKYRLTRQLPTTQIDFNLIAEGHAELSRIVRQRVVYHSKSERAVWKRNLP